MTYKYCSCKKFVAQKREVKWDIVNSPYNICPFCKQKLKTENKTLLFKIYTVKDILYYHDNESEKLLLNEKEYHYYNEHKVTIKELKEIINEM